MVRAEITHKKTCIGRVAMFVCSRYQDFMQLLVLKKHLQSATSKIFSVKAFMPSHERNSKGEEMPYVNSTLICIDID